MHKATLITKSKDPESIANAISVDNIQGETNFEHGTIRTTMSSDRISTLLATLDDLLCCQMVAESTIENG